MTGNLPATSATAASTSDIRAVLEERGTLAGQNGILLYLDEIQYLNKKQQQTLLEYIEDGSVTLIASTTENPYFYVYNAILSRCTVFEFKPVEPPEIARALSRARDILRDELGHPLEIEPEALDYLTKSCGGDVRKALNAVELLAFGSGGEGRITLEAAKACPSAAPCATTATATRIMISFPRFKNPCAARMKTPRCITSHGFWRPGI
jgi:putative ATPase